MAIEGDADKPVEKEEVETKISFWEKVKECWDWYEITDTLVIIFTLLLPITVGYIIAINLSIILQGTIVSMIFLFSYLLERNWIGFNYRDTETLNMISLIILFGMIIGNIVYYFTWFDGSINWLNPFVPS